MGARQYSRCHDRHVHRLTSPPARHPVHVQQCFKIMHVITEHTIHSDLWMNNSQWSVNGIPTISPLARIRIKCEQSVVCGTMHYCFCAGKGPPVCFVYKS